MFCQKIDPNQTIIAHYYMKKHLITFFTLCGMLSFSSCLTRIITVAEKPVSTTTTTVYVPRTTTNPTPTTTVVTNRVVQEYYTNLDLRAVAAAFGEAMSVPDFERILNNGQYMISNLDLNHDGYVDYLRVMETMNGYAHLLIIQAVLAPSVYQDVASVIVECQPGYTYVQIVGDPYLYGTNYIIEPIYARAPAMYDYMFSHSGHTYTCYSSPYYWNNYPRYYSHSEPVYGSHYQAYVTSYISHHTYYRDIRYTDTYHYSDYMNLGREIRCQDYSTRHADQSYTTRHNGGSAREIESARTSTSKKSSARTSTGTSTARTSTSARTNTGSTQSRTPADRVTPTTTITTRVNTNTGAARTITKSVDANGTTTTVKRSTNSTSSRQTTKQAPTTTRHQSTSGRQTSTSSRR